MNWEQLTIDASGLDCDRLLADWRWLVPVRLRPFSLTLFGDWFFEDQRGYVVFLDTVAGRLTDLTPSRVAFLAARDDPENRNAWYMAYLAERCRERGIVPGPGQCLSFTLPPVLGGSLNASNVEPCDLLLHQSITAQIHRGAKGMPEGTRIRKFVQEPPFERPKNPPMHRTEPAV